MCGVLLILSKNKSLNEKDCWRASRKIKTRGPDKFLQNFFFKKKLYIANSILSITGKNKGQSPSLVSSANKKYFIAFNGEIYNWRDLRAKYKLRYQNNDTELLVNLFQKLNMYSLPKKLDGMFAYCVYDREKNKIYIASDPQGEKKLFYFNNKNFSIISSTISAIIAFLKKEDLNIKSFKNYFFTRHFLFHKSTCYKNIRVLEPGVVYTLGVKRHEFFSKKFENPLNWISKSRMKRYSMMTENQVTNHLEKIIINQLKIMIPEKRFGSIFSGGVDSSLQSALLSKISQPHLLMTLNHIGKDNITKNIFKFKRYLNTKLHVVDVNKAIYTNDVWKCYRITNFPFLTHDFVGKRQLAEFFKKKGCKVFFAADGADELFGGYELYKKLNWNSKKIENHSPYSNFKSKNSKFNELWLKAFKRYSFIKNIKHRKMQASLFTDYFIQAIYVGNIGTDIMCSHSGIEPRNVFIQKKIIKEALNLPLKYKINLSAKDPKMILKPLLKKIFFKHFNKKLIFRKQGFSGYPNEARTLLRKEKKYNRIKKLKLDFNEFKKHFSKRAYEWKLLNLELFFKFYSQLK